MSGEVDYNCREGESLRSGSFVLLVSINVDAVCEVMEVHSSSYMLD